MQKPDINNLLKLVAAAAYAAYSNTLCGNPSPNQEAYYKRMSNPEVGDLVLEISRLRGPKVIDSIGRLISITNEPFPDWEDDEPVPKRDVWTIKTLDDREFRWENCNFIVIPEDPYNHQGKISEKEE
jgi:hypothetical protein